MPGARHLCLILPLLAACAPAAKRPADESAEPKPAENRAEPAPQAEAAADTPASEADQLVKWESYEAMEEFIGASHCPVISKDGNHLACFRDELDMGHLTVFMSVHDTTTGSVTKELAVFDGLSDLEDQGFGRAWDEANTLLAEQGFHAGVQGLDEQRTVEMKDGKLFAADAEAGLKGEAPLPPIVQDPSGLTKEEVRRVETCCHWHLGETFFVPETAAAMVRLVDRCDFVNTHNATKDAKKECVDPEHSEEGEVPIVKLVRVGLAAE